MINNLVLDNNYSNQSTVLWWADKALTPRRFPQGIEPQLMVKHITDHSNFSWSCSCVDRTHYIDCISSEMAEDAAKEG